MLKSGGLAREDALRKLGVVNALCGAAERWNEEWEACATSDSRCNNGR